MTKEMEMMIRDALINRFGINTMLFYAYDNNIEYPSDKLSIVRYYHNLKIETYWCRKIIKIGEENIDFKILLDYLYSVLDKTIEMKCPREGEFIGYKKALELDKHLSPVIIKLRIPEDAKRSSGANNKCRCSKAFVEDIYGNSEYRRHLNLAASDFDKDFTYEKGKYVSVPFFDNDRFETCSCGIHFYLTEEEAINHPLIHHVMDSILQSV